jgi:hypothetical protein
VGVGLLGCGPGSASEDDEISDIDFAGHFGTNLPMDAVNP